MAEKEQFEQDQEIKEYLQNAKAGYDEAIVILLNRYQPLIESFVKQVTDERWNDADKEDLRQELQIAFCQLFSTYDVEQDQISFGYYAKICLRNTAYSFLRQRKKRAEEPVDLIVDDDENGFDLASEDDPFSHHVLHEKMKVVQKAIDTELSDFEKTIWYLHTSDLKVKEIATRVNKTPKAIENALARTKAKLRTALKNSGLVD